MAIIPYAVDVPYDRRPFMNWLLVASVITTFGLQFLADVNGEMASVEQYVLDGWGIRGFFGHMWLHGGPFHLFGNMLFLWLFGNAVCAKIDNLKYLPVYLLLGLFAALTHLIFDGGPAIGASGAINGVVGMFLIFFWENEVDCLWVFLPFVKKFSVSSFWIIGLWLVYDIIGAFSGGGNVGYFAHLGGFFAGVAVAVLLLKLNLVTMYRDEESLVEKVEKWLQDRRDSQLRKQARTAVESTKQVSAPLPVPVSEPTPAMVRFLCSCGKKIKAPANYAGKKGRCPQCQQSLIIPQTEYIQE